MTKMVAITGADGLIGSSLRQALAERYTLRLLAGNPIDGAEASVVDIAEMQALLPVFEGCDTVVHLAANASPDASWNDVLRNNIMGTYNVFEAAKQARVKQVIFASSNHAVGTYERIHQSNPDQPTARTIDHLVPIAPDSLYGVSKAFGEALGRYYADYHEMRVICIRIGWITPDDMPRGKLVSAEASMWQSKRDFAQLVEKCIEAEQIKFDIFYGVSNNPFRLFDIEHARKVIGYAPQDRSVERLAQQENSLRNQENLSGN